VTEATVREQRAASYGIRSNDERDVPLHLLPLLILQFVRQTGTRIYRISVKRTHWHHYNISVRTKSLPKELTPGRIAGCRSPEDIMTENRQNTGGSGPGCEA